MKLVYMGLFVWLTFVTAVSAEEFRVSRFSTEGLTGWETKVFKDKTNYTLLQENGATVVKAQSRASASALYKKVALDPLHYRYLRWSWKVAGIISKGQEKSKAGDDFAARGVCCLPRPFFLAVTGHQLYLGQPSSGRKLIPEPLYPQRHYAGG